MAKSNRYEQLNAEVAGLKAEMKGVQTSLEKNNESTAALREDFQHLRGEINGILPRMDKNVERIFDQLREHQETVKGYHEKVRVNEEQIDILFNSLNGKADAEANRESHSRLWMAIRISLMMLAASVLCLVLRQVLLG